MNPVRDKLVICNPEAIQTSGYERNYRIVFPDSVTLFDVDFTQGDTPANIILGAQKPYNRINTQRGIWVEIAELTDKKVIRINTTKHSDQRPPSTAPIAHIGFMSYSPDPKKRVYHGRLLITEVNTKLQYEYYQKSTNNLEATESNKMQMCIGVRTKEPITKVEIKKKQADSFESSYMTFQHWKNRVFVDYPIRLDPQILDSDHNYMNRAEAIMRNFGQWNTPEGQIYQKEFRIRRMDLKDWENALKAWHRSKNKSDRPNENKNGEYITRSGNKW